MSKEVTSVDEIPDAEYYVVADDTILSNWGDAKGRINRVILPCEDKEEVDTVKAYVESRSDMENIRVLVAKPSLPSKRVMYSLMSKENASRWYSPI